MPHILPEAVVQQVQAVIPPTHKMWWIRGLVLSVQQINTIGHISNQIPNVNIKVQVLDVDTEEEAYDIVLLGQDHDIANGDIISLFGHEPVEAKAVGKPRFFFNHNTGWYTRAYPENLFRSSTWNAADFKNWLGCKTSLSSSGKRKKFAAICGLFFLSILLTSGLSLFLLWIIIPVMVGKHFLTRASRQTEFGGKNRPTEESNLLFQAKDYVGHSYQNITPLYEEVSCAVDGWVEDHPDTAKGFVMAARGRSKQGLLPEENPAKGALPE